jgi:hypothetical protein
VPVVSQFAGLEEAVAASGGVMSTTDAPTTKLPAVAVRAWATAREAITMAARVANMPRVYAQRFAAVNDCLTLDRAVS